MNEKQRSLLSALNIVEWQQRTAEKAIMATEPLRDSLESSDPNIDWESLQTMISGCTRCELHRSRLHTVFGSGNRHADLVIVGEAPGANEDRQGLPFVGRAGQLLTKMLAAIRLNRDQVFICNVLKCRPPNNRDPLPKEVATCSLYLEQQLAHIKPKCLLAVGRIAAHYLLGVEKPLSQLRGIQWQFGTQNIPLFITYHPAYLLRNPRDKRKAYLDLCQVAAFIDQLALSP